VIAHANGEREVWASLSSGWKRLTYLSNMGDSISVYLGGKLLPTERVQTGFSAPPVLPVSVTEAAPASPSSDALKVSDNPFKNSTTVQLNIVNTEHISLMVFNTIGVLMTTPVNGDVTSGTYEYPIDAQTWATGVYIVRLQSGNETITKRIVKIQ
jgi:hypothetical protein